MESVDSEVGGDIVRINLIVVFMVFFSGLSGLTQAASWGLQTTIIGYYSDPGTNNIVFTTANNQNPNTCSSSHYLVINSGASNFNQVFAMLVSAQAAGSPVALYYNGCLGPYPLITSIAVPNSW